MASSTTVGQIVYDAVINTDGMKKGATEADKTAKATGDNMQKNIGKAAVAVGASMVATGAIFMKVTADSLKSTVQWAGGVAKLSRETGASVDSISRLAYAGQRYGLTTDDLSKSLGIFSKKVVEANKGNNETADTFNKLGVSLKGADGKMRPFDQIFGQVAEKFKTAPNGMDKTALAMQLFGKSGKDMLPLLNQGADGIAKLGNEAKKFGLVLTNDNIKAFGEFRKATFDSEQSAKGLKVQLGLLTLGPMTKLRKSTTEATQKLNEMNPAMKNVIGSMIVFGGPVLSMGGSLLAAAGSVAMLSVAFGGLTAVLGPVALVIAALVAWVALGYVVWRNWSTIMKTIGPVLQPIITYFTTLFKILSEQLKPIIEWSIRNWDMIKKVLMVLVAVALIPLIASIVGLTVVLGVIIGVVVAVIWAFQQFIQKARDLYNNVVNAFNGMRNAVNSFVASANSGLWAFISVVAGIPNRIRAVFNGAGNWLYNAGRDIVGGLINGIKSAIGGAVNAISGAANSIKDKFASVLKIRSPSRVFAEFGKNITQGLANGITGNLGVVSGSMNALTATANISPSPSISSLEGASVGQGSNNKTVVNVDMSGIMARSKADEREIAKSLIARVNEELRSKGKPVIGGGAI